MGPKKRTTRSTPATPTTTTSVTNEQLRALINQGVADALAARDADRSMNGDDSHNSGTSVRRTECVARECTYQDFMKCQPLFFKGTEGVKFATCTLLGVALTWWNSHVRTVGHDVAYAMTWINLKKKMTDKYCPRNEIKKLEAELWNLKVKDRVIWFTVSVFAERQAEENMEEITLELTTTKLNNNFQEENVAQVYAAGTGERKEYARTLPLCNKCKVSHKWPVQ
ncbi:reverse transcriptase domain-containing protein [Tanacetum coccineum]